MMRREERQSSRGQRQRKKKDYTRGDGVGMGARWNGWGREREKKRAALPATDQYTSTNTISGLATGTPGFRCSLEESITALKLHADSCDIPSVPVAPGYVFSYRCSRMHWPNYTRYRAKLIREFNIFLLGAWLLDGNWHTRSLPIN